MKVAHLAEAFNLPLTSHGASRRHRAPAGRGAERVLPRGARFGIERFIAEPLAIKDGFAIAPERPGHGITFDWAALDRVRAG